MFASTKKNFELNNNNIAVFGVRGGGDDGLVQENPEYEPPKDSSVDNSDSTDDDDTSDGSDSEESDIEDEETADEEVLDDDDDDNEEEEVVEKDLASLSKSKRSISKSKSSKQRSSVNKRIYKLWRHNQVNIYILLAIIAFRKDIYHFCIQYHIIPTQVNPITGERKIVVRWSTDVLKLILVAEAIRRCFLPSRSSIATSDDDDGAIEKRNETQTSDGMDEDMPKKPSPALPLLLLLMLVILPTLLRRNISSGYTPLLLPIVTSFIFRSIRGGTDSDLMKWIMPGDGDLATRMAYLPPLEQHYAFEQLNERYWRDWGAWRKAFPTNPALQSHHYHLGRNGSSETGAGNGGSAGSPMMSLIDAITSRKSSSSQLKQRKQSGMPKSKVSSLSNVYPHVYDNGTAIVLDMTKLDTQASSMERIRDQISFLVHLVQSEDEEFFRSKPSVKVESESTTSKTTANITSAPLDDNQATKVSAPQLEVIVLLESPGGSVSSYGLAASHLQRLRTTPGIKLTICVDSVAASGGYMMACMASPGQLLCAPYAMVGSIGVLGQSVNIQKALEKYGIRPYVFLGGKNKQPVGMFGDVTKGGIETMQVMIDRIHDSFREHVREAREESLVKAFVAEGDADKPPSHYFQLGSQTKLTHSQQSLDRVANGDVFLGVQALKLGLVDRLITSDEYIAERIRHGTRVLKLIIHRRPVGLSSLLMGPPHPSFAWKKWITGAKSVASMISSTWSDSDSLMNNVQMKMDTSV
jgi:ClpP class serine protease